MTLPRPGLAQWAHCNMYGCDEPSNSCNMFDSHNFQVQQHRAAMSGLPYSFRSRNFEEVVGSIRESPSLALPNHSSPCASRKCCSFKKTRRLPLISAAILLGSGARRTNCTVRPWPCPLRRAVPPSDASRSRAARTFCRLAAVRSRLEFFAKTVPQLSKNCDTQRNESTPASCIGSRLLRRCVSLGLSKAPKSGWKKAPCAHNSKTQASRQ